MAYLLARGRDRKDDLFYGPFESGDNARDWLVTIGVYDEEAATIHVLHEPVWGMT